ncbi:ankyrin repeat-containing domain protein [Aspergillus alliaceus]|uniref:Ankyrin repeat-containing domain protein n=1 Tax=Petromyces alliaceus TaxID=209559 RepID=A0A5N7BVT6_PETAA|nr:ankyrin repeat-containing domain protein [Aspergillus alliaceus]
MQRNTPKEAHALQRAIAFGDIPKVSFLLEAGYDPNKQGEFYGDPLSAAVYHCHKHPRVVQALPEKGASPNSSGGERHGPPLVTTAEAGNLNVIQMLLDAGANVHCHGGRYNTALQAVMTASDHRNKHGIIKLLLNYGANACITSGQFYSALSSGFTLLPRDDCIISQLLDYTLSQKPRKDLLDHTIRAAACLRDLASVQILLSAGAGPNAVAEAVESANIDLVRFLVVRGADINIDEDCYGTRLAIASYYRLTEIFECSPEHGADVNLVSERYGTPLQAAAFAGNTELVKRLFDRGADLNISCGHWGSPLIAAANAGFKEIIMLLLHSGADINKKGGDPGTELRAACEMGDLRSSQTTYQLWS